MKWYTIRVVSGKEKKIRETIENQLKINNSENILNTLLIPTYKNIQLRKGKKTNVEKNIFPGYIFVECESIDNVEANIKHISGVSTILKQPLSDIEVNRLIGKKDDMGNKTLKINDTVKIIDGPFNSFTGTIKEMDLNKEKIKLSVSIFDREVLLDVTQSQIIKE